MKFPKSPTFALILPKKTPNALVLFDTIKMPTRVEPRFVKV